MELLGREMAGNFFYMPQICDMGQTALLPFRRKACWGFFTLKNPMASARFEPANLGTKGQHATSRPPKPLFYPLLFHSHFQNCYFSWEYVVVFSVLVTCVALDDTVFRQCLQMMMVVTFFFCIICNIGQHDCLILPCGSEVLLIVYMWGSRRACVQIV